MTATAEARSVHAPVEGGDLHALVWGDGPGVMLAIHGVTASAASIQPVADRLAGEWQVIAPDLRGRGRSAGLPGPYGMAAHADDAVALLDHLGVPEACVMGQSMGGYVAVQLAVSQPDRVAQLFLIDGGVPLPIPPGIDPDDLVATVLGPSLQRLRMTFESRLAYRDYWRSHPAFQGDDWNPYVEAYLDYDLTGEEPELRSAVVEEAVLADSRDQLVNADLQRLSQIRCPISLVRAERNLQNQLPGLFPDVIVNAYKSALPQLVDRVVADTSHYSLMFTDRGADAIAAAVRADQDAAR